jgi:hypothetical protein
MRARLSPFAPLLLAPLLAGCGGPLLYAELEMPSVEVTLPQYTFPGDPLGLSTVKDVSFDVGANVPVVNEPDVELELRLTRMTMVLGTSGPLSNFDGFQTVTITALHPSGDPARDLVLLRYEKPAGATDITRISASSSTDADLRPFLDAGVINVRAAYASDGINPTLPTSDWTADLTAEFRFQVTLDYGAYL